MSQDDTNPDKLWSGRFSEATDAFVERFTASVDFDKRLYRADITASIAHASMLKEAGILTEKESAQIIDGLEEIKIEIEQNKFNWSVKLEDVHTNIEAALTKRIGHAGKKLHTGRSRNDQVATWRQTCIELPAPRNTERADCNLCAMRIILDLYR